MSECGVEGSACIYMRRRLLLATAACHARTLIVRSAEPVTNHSLVGSTAMHRTQPRWPEITRIIFHGACHSGFGRLLCVLRRGMMCVPLLADEPATLTTAVDGAPFRRSAAVLGAAAGALPSCSMSGAEDEPTAEGSAGAAATTAEPAALSLGSGRSLTMPYSALSFTLIRIAALRVSDRARDERRILDAKGIKIFSLRKRVP